MKSAVYNHIDNTLEFKKHKSKLYGILFKEFVYPSMKLKMSEMEEYFISYEYEDMYLDFYELYKKKYGWVNEK